MIPEKIRQIEYLTNEPEGQYFDRKSAKIRPLDILKHVVGFANAGGGILVIGIDDNGIISGFDYPEANSIEEFKNIALVKLIETPVITESLEIEVINSRGAKDKVLILSIPTSNNRVVKSHDGSVYLRFGDKTQKLNFEQIIQLQYDKGECFFEDELVRGSSIADVDNELINHYKAIMEVESATTESILAARNFLVDGMLTNAAILLFGNNPTKFLPQARLRFIRYDGSIAQVGKNLNIIKERTFDGAIPIIIQEAKAFINTQLREFQYLGSDGLFKVMPEYPEFAWVEGIVNALTHRNYSIRGDYIRVIMFDDRLEIHSPGALPNVVTLENIKERRYSRNPRIARVLSEFGWVKEMNEGVKRIYSEMENAFLNEPKYSEPNNSNVLLILENNILNRQIRQIESLLDLFGQEELSSLSPDQIKLLQVVYNRGTITSKVGAEFLKRSGVYTSKNLQHLASKGYLIWHGNSKTDPTQYYAFNYNYVNKSDLSSLK